MKKRIIALSIATSLAMVPQSSLGDDSASGLFFQGRTDEARARYLDEIRSAEGRTQSLLSWGAEYALWKALIAYAWFLDETGDHREAIEQSNRALEIAIKKDDPFMLGRSLSWLGWAYSALGLYQTAETFYKEALDIAAPGGTPRYIPVWGLAKQELGYLHFKMGDVATAKQFIGETMSFARENGVLIGVAEGGVRLAEIALQEGNLGAATLYAAEAKRAAEQCACTPFTLVHAKNELAQIAVATVLRGDSTGLLSAQKAIAETAEAAKALGIKRFTAEAKLLEAKLVPAHEFERRYTLVREAFETLANMESERRGDAEIAVGRMFLDNADIGLADFYIKHGIEVNEQMMRTVDKAYVLMDLAQLARLRGEDGEKLKKLQESADEARSSGALPAAAEGAEQLFRELSQLGYTSMAMKWGRLALEHFDALIAQEADGRSRGLLERKRLNLIEELGADALELLPPPGGQPE